MSPFGSLLLGVLKRDIDATHYFSQQVEGLFIDKNVTLGHLKATLEGLVEDSWVTKVQTHFRPAFTPLWNRLDLDIVASSAWRRMQRVRTAGLGHPLRNGAPQRAEVLWSRSQSGTVLHSAWALIIVMLRATESTIRRLWWSTKRCDNSDEFFRQSQRLLNVQSDSQRAAMHIPSQEDEPETADNCSDGMQRSRAY